MGKERIIKEKSIKESIVFNMMYTFFNLAFPLISFPYAARCLLADGMGIVSFYSSIANYAVVIGAMGISTYGIRKVAQVRNSKAILTKTIEELFLLNEGISLFVVLVIIFCSFFVPRLRDSILLLTINCIYIAMAPFGLEWAFSGLELYKFIALRSFVFKIISLVLLFIVVHSPSDYIKYALIMTFSGAGSWIVNFIHIRKFVSSPFPLAKLSFRSHLKPMLLLFSSLLAVSIYTNVDIIMLGFIGGDRDVGYYVVATKIKMVLLALINSISTVLLPRMSFYVQNNSREQYQRIIKKSMGAIFEIAIPCVVFFEIAAVETIYLLGGEDYDRSVLCMQILMPILLISGFSNVVGNQILIPNGRDKAFLKAVTCGALCDIILNALLMPKYYAIGAATATLIAEIVQMSIQTYHATKELQGNVCFRRIVIIGLGSVCIGGITEAFIKTISLDSYVVNLLIKVIICGGLFIVMFLLQKESTLIEIVRDIKNNLYKSNI